MTDTNRTNPANKIDFDIDVALSTENYLRKKSHNSGGGATTKRAINFAEKLHFVLSHKECKDAITWVPSGQSFCITNKQKFVEQILPKFFKSTSSIPNFERRLKSWGFEKIDTKTNMYIFTHETFHKDSQTEAETKGGTDVCFMTQLRVVLSDTDCQPFISWLPSGKSFSINHKGSFVKHVLSKFFGDGTNFRDFTAKLKSQGFMRIGVDDFVGDAVYSHELFQIGRPDLCSLISRGQFLAHSSGASRQDTEGLSPSTPSIANNAMPSVQNTNPTSDVSIPEPNGIGSPSLNSQVREPCTFQAYGGVAPNNVMPGVQSTNPTSAASFPLPNGVGSPSFNSRVNELYAPQVHGRVAPNNVMPGVQKTNPTSAASIPVPNGVGSPSLNSQVTKTPQGYGGVAPNMNAPIPILQSGFNPPCLQVFYGKPNTASLLANRQQRLQQPSSVYQIQGMPQPSVAHGQSLAIFQQQANLPNGSSHRDLQVPTVSWPSAVPAAACHPMTLLQQQGNLNTNNLLTLEHSRVGTSPLQGLPDSHTQLGKTDLDIKLEMLDINRQLLEVKKLKLLTLQRKLKVQMEMEGKK